MNPFFVFILVALVGFYLLNSLASWLNLASLKPELPPEFSDVYDQAEYRRLLQYSAVSARFSRLSATFDLVVLLAFWFFGGFAWLDSLVRGWHFSPILTGLCFIGALALASKLLSLPFTIYDTFVIEQNFGFNKTTARTFVADQCKSSLLALLFGIPLIAIVLALFQYGGGFAWLYGWIIVAAITLILSWLAPAVIMPLFNKFTPLEEGALRKSILAYAEKNRFPLADVFVMDGSRRSTRANAFFTGFGKTKKIALFDTLIASHSVDELVAVLAHEIGHYKLRHIFKHLAVSIISLGIFFALAGFFIRSPQLFSAFGISPAHVSVYAGLVFFMILYAPLSQLLAIGSYWLMRRHEFEADHFAATTTGQPQALADALKKLSKSNLANLAPHPLYVALHHSHPPVLQRIAALLEVKTG